MANRIGTVYPCGLHGSLAKWVQCSPMIWETWVQSQIKSYQRLLKWYLIPPCLTLSNIRYVSRVKWSNPGKGVAPSPTPWCSSYWKGSLLVTLDYGRQLYFTFYSCGLNKGFSLMFSAGSRVWQETLEEDQGTF